MIRKVVNPDSLAKPVGYNNGILVDGGSMLFVAGQVAWDRNGRIVSERFSDQFGQALSNVLDVVWAAGGDAGSVSKLTIFVADKDEYVAQLKDVGVEYRRLMGKHFPAMTRVDVK